MFAKLNDGKATMGNLLGFGAQRRVRCSLGTTVRTRVLVVVFDRGTILHRSGLPVLARSRFGQISKDESQLTVA